jgi:hypothetical protein
MNSLETNNPPPSKKKNIRKIIILNDSSPTTTTTTIDLETAYIQSFSEKEHKAYLIAKSHLLTSFSLKKSNGYLNFIKSLPTAHEG